MFLTWILIKNFKSLFTFYLNYIFYNLENIVINIYLLHIY